MDLRTEILREHSKSQKDKIVTWIGSHQQRFDELVQLFLHGESRIVQRAAWPLSYAALQHPFLVKKHLGKLVRNLRRRDLHDAVKRNTMRILQVIPVPVRLQGILMNTCFDYITDPAEKAAVKAFSLTVLDKLSREYPEIRHELHVIITERWDQESAAFKSRARNILKTPRSNH
jgi:hypothetical protein